MYKVGFPGCKIAVRFDIPLLARVHAQRDLSNIQIATSQGFQGLVIEVSTFCDLVAETSAYMGMLLFEQLKHVLKREPVNDTAGKLVAA